METLAVMNDGSVGSGLILSVQNLPRKYAGLVTGYHPLKCEKIDNFQTLGRRGKIGTNGVGWLRPLPLPRERSG